MKRCLSFCVALLVLGLVPSLVRAQAQKLAVERVPDLTYGKVGDSELKLDLAIPKEGDGPFPVVICIHGGAWRGGQRQDLAQTLDVLAGRGYVAATISYRLAPAAKFPAQIEDAKAAVRWLRTNAKKYKIDPDRIGAVGFSAGAHLACLLGVTDKSDGLEGNGGDAEQSSRVQAVVSFFGPTDMNNKDWSEEVETGILIPFLGASYADKPELYRKTSSINYVKKGAPPFLFFHGTQDTLVGIRHSRSLAAKLKEVGTSAKVVEMEGEAHGWRGEKLIDTFKQTVAFFDETLKAKK